MNVDLLLDARAQIGEGPIWDSRNRLLTWVDLLEGTVNSTSLTSGAVGPGVAAPTGYRIGCAIPTAGGSRFVVGTDRGFGLLDRSGHFELVAEVEADKRSFMNDGKCDALGRLWAGTVGEGEGHTLKDGAGCLYRLDPDQTVTVVETGVSISNGMDWSPDGKTFYYIDSRRGRVDAYPFDLETGSIGTPQRAAEIAGASKDVFADGMCVDADGGLWIAVWGAGEVRRYTPQGALDQTIVLPVTQPTSCAFAGDHLETLVITSARFRLSGTDLSAQPLAGGIFCCRPGPTGTATNVFADAAGWLKRASNVAATE